MAQEEENTDVNLENASQSSAAEGTDNQDGHAPGDANDPAAQLESSRENERLRSLADENASLKRMLDLVTSRTENRPAPQAEPRRSKLNREQLTPTELALLDEIEEVRSENQMYRGVLGTHADEMDRLAVQSNKQLAPLYAANQASVERYRKQRAEQGTYLTRQEALALLLLENGQLTKPKAPVKLETQRVNPPAKPAGKPNKDNGEEKPLKDKLAGVKF